MSLHSPAALVKSDQAYLAFRSTESGPPHGPVEIELFEFKGDLCSITAIAPSGNYSGQLRVDVGLHRPLKVIDAPDMSYPCVHVEDGTVFIYGSSVDHHRISMMRSTDLINWSSPVVVFTATGGMEFYNTSVAKHTMSGTYRMAVETKDPAYQPANYFVVRRLGATNPTNWTMLTGVFHNDHYVNCPMIRYVGDVLYMAFMENAGTSPNDLHYTFIARSLDHGATWERGYGADGQTIPLVPSLGEGNNNSDMTICEFEGETYILYGSGDQTAWLECKTAVYPGTNKQYFEQFFPTTPPPPTPTNQIPAMTGQTTGNCKMTASSTHGTFYPWLSGDRNAATFMHFDATLSYPHTLIVEFLDANRTVSSIKIKARSGLPQQAPKAFDVVSVVGSIRTVVGSFTNQVFTDGVFKVLTLTPSTAQRFEVVVASNGSSGADLVNCAIGEIELIGTV